MQPPLYRWMDQQSQLSASWLAGWLRPDINQTFHLAVSSQKASRETWLHHQHHQHRPSHSLVLPSQPASQRANRWRISSFCVISKSWKRHLASTGEPAHTRKTEVFHEWVLTEIIGKFKYILFISAIIGIITDSRQLSIITTTPLKSHPSQCTTKFRNIFAIWKWATGEPETEGQMKEG